jgi:hypothetical protein
MIIRIKNLILQNKSSNTAATLAQQLTTTALPPHPIGKIVTDTPFLGDKMTAVR